MNKGTLKLQKILESFKNMTPDEYKTLFASIQSYSVQSNYQINISGVASVISYNDASQLGQFHTFDKTNDKNIIFSGSSEYLLKDPMAA